MMKSMGKSGMSVSKFVHELDSPNQQMEANLCTMLQSVRGTKQFWYLKKNDLLCMIREYSPPSLFLTLRCAEYESPEISANLLKVNQVSDKYPIGKLCTEDPVSVSCKFSQKFHDFFSSIILKGNALGKVTHYFYKKEYQARGAPHYHILLWIEDDPVVGKSSSEEVILWIQKTMTCRNLMRRQIQNYIG